MDTAEFKAAVERAPLRSRADYDHLYMLVTAGEGFLPAYEAHGARSQTLSEFADAIFQDEALKDTPGWAECAKLGRRNWLCRFQPQLLIENLRLKTDGMPIQLGTGVVLAPTGSRDNIANLYVFGNGAFNRQAAEFVTSIGGRFTLADYDFCGIYGLYKYRGNVILEAWEVEEPPVHNPQP